MCGGEGGGMRGVWNRKGVEGGRGYIKMRRVGGGGGEGRGGDERCVRGEGVKGGSVWCGECGGCPRWEEVGEGVHASLPHTCPSFTAHLERFIVPLSALC